MPKLILDIETIGESFDALDAVAQEQLLRGADTDDERAAARELTALWPVTGEVVVIGMLNPDTGRGRVLFRDGGADVGADQIGAMQKNNAAHENDGIMFEPVPDEKTLLEKFWDDVKAYQQIITFNGRGFDAPYLMIRSAARGVAATKNLMPPRFQSYEHLDLAEALSFFGATRKFSLHLFCHAFGIQTPKDDADGAHFDGKEVTAAFARGEYLRIAEYNARDLRATAAVYEKWRAVVGE